MQRRTAAFRRVGEFAVFVHTEEPPTDPEWDQLLNVFRSSPTSVAAECWC